MRKHRHGHVLLLATALLCACVSFTFAAGRPYRTLEVDNYTASSSLQQNRLGRPHGVFYQRPSEIRFMFNKDMGNITYTRTENGIVGYFTNLGARTIDLTPFDVLEISGIFAEAKDLQLHFVTGDTPTSTETVSVPLKQYENGRKGFTIPLSSLPELDLRMLTGLRLQPGRPGEGSFSVQKIQFIQFTGPSYANKTPDTFQIDDFNGALNRFGNRDAIYRQAPSEMRIVRLNKAADDTSDRCLMISAKNEENGYAIYAMPLLYTGHLFDLKNFRSILLKVRGGSAGDDAEIAFSDGSPDGYLHPWKAGKLSTFLGHPLSTQWEGCIIPVDAFGPVPGNKINELLLIFPQEKSTTLYIDDLRFSVKRMQDENTESPRPKDLLLFSFNGKTENLFGAPLLPFAEGTATVSVKTTFQGTLSANGPCAEVHYKKTSDAACGLTSSLKSDTGYFNASDHSALSFQVRGDPGTVLEVYLLDKNGEAAANGGMASTFKKITVRNISGQWQWVTVPISDFQVDTAAISALVISFPEKGENTFYIDTVTLVR